MSFVSEFNALPLRHAEPVPAVRDGGRSRPVWQSQPEPDGICSTAFPAASELLETLCQRSQAVTRQRFGKVIRLFAPLYLSNECINNCKYCGFSRDNPILRVTLSIDDVLREARALKEQGFRNLLLVAGEHPKFVLKRLHG